MDRFRNPFWKDSRGKYDEFGSAKSIPKRSPGTGEATNRQNAVHELVEICDLIIVCGSPHSSNSNRLRETAIDAGVDSYIIDIAAELELSWFDHKCKVGITSGASVPQSVVDNTVDWIQSHFGPLPVHQGENIESTIKFPIPNI